MKHFIDVIKRVMKMCFVMLLINFKNCRIEENKEVKMSYLIIKRDKRENFDDAIVFEIIDVYDIDVFDVINEMTNDVIDDSINVEKIAIDVNDAFDAFDAFDVEKNEIDEVDFSITKNEVDFSSFVCFVRTCS